ncbi:MAG: hypothetical protein ACI9F9_000915 [Candidatus Paceibacteria bacterium]|jgi:hypothetical protein
MKPSARILDENLAKLLQRAYQPVRPSDAFVRQLEASLAPWIGELADGAETLDLTARAGHGKPRWIASSLAAAAALLLLMNWSGFFDGGGLAEPNLNQGATQVASLDGLLAEGAVALRPGNGEAWRAATSQELTSGLEWNSAELEVATPDNIGFELLGSEGWNVALAASSRLTIHPRGDVLQFQLNLGTAEFSAHEQSLTLAAPDSVEWNGFEFREKPGTSLTLADPGSLDQGGRQSVVVEPAPEPEQPEVVSEQPLAGRAMLQGTLVFSEDHAGSEPFQVTLLREVALPQVSNGDSLDFTGASFTWNDIQPGNYTVYVTHPQHAVWKSAVIALAADEVSTLSAELEVGVSARGFVVDKESGSPIAGALVVCEGDLPSGIIGVEESQFPEVFRAFTYTGADGSFELAQLSAGVHKLRANGVEHSPAWVTVEKQGDVPQFELTVGGVLEGRCEHPDGKPFANGLIIASCFGGGGQGKAMTYSQIFTDENGEYRVEHLAETFYVALFFEDFSPSQSFQPKYRPVGIREGEPQRVDFLGIDRGASIHGVVVDGEGRPLPFVNVHLWQGEADNNDWQGETADAQGRYELVGVVPGTYTLYAGEARSMILSCELTITEGARLERNIELRGMDLDVKVMDGDTGERVGFTNILFVDRAADVSGGEVAAKVFSTGDGLNELRHLGAGTYDLYALPEAVKYSASVLRSILIDEGSIENELEVRLERACTAQLTVLDEKGKPLRQVKLRLFGPDGEEWPAFIIPAPTADGVTELGRLSPGRWSFEFSLEGHQTNRIELVCTPWAPAMATLVLIEE